MVFHEGFLKALGLKALEKELFTTKVEKPDQLEVFHKQAMVRATRLARAVRFIGYHRFREFWILERLEVSLQLRLWVETVLFSMDKPFSNLVSGFKPLRIKI